MNLLKNKLISSILLLAYVYLTVFSLFTLTEHHHALMENCPFMMAQTSLCAMDSFEHLGAWEAFLLSIPNLIYLFGLVVIVFWILKNFSALSPPLLRRHLYARKRLREPVFLKLEMLFFNGFLNPKPY